MTKTEFPQGFFEKPRPHATNLYIAVEHEIEDGGWIEPITKLVLCKDCIKKGLCSIYRDARQEYGFCKWGER